MKINSAVPFHSVSGFGQIMCNGKHNTSKGLKSTCTVGFVLSLVLQPLLWKEAKMSLWNIESRPRCPVVPADIQLTLNIWESAAKISRTELTSQHVSNKCFLLCTSEVLQLLLHSIILVTDDDIAINLLVSEGTSQFIFLFWWTSFKISCKPTPMCQFPLSTDQELRRIHEGGIREYLFYCISCQDVNMSHSPWPRRALLFPHRLVLLSTTNTTYLLFVLPHTTAKITKCHHLQATLQRSRIVTLDPGGENPRRRPCPAVLPRCEYNPFI